MLTMQDIQELKRSSEALQEKSESVNDFILKLFYAKQLKNYTEQYKKTSNKISGIVFFKEYYYHYKIYIKNEKIIKLEVL